MEKIIYTVPGINCNHCIHTIKMELSELPGIVNIEADASRKEVKVSFESPATSESIEKVLAQINYPVSNKQPQE